MNRRSRIYFIVLVFLVFLSCAAGCTSVRNPYSHNTTVAVQSYNTWVAEQEEFIREMPGTFGIIGDHVSTYNAEIAKDHPNFLLLRSNLAQDRQLLDRWGSRLDNLTASTDRFEQDTKALIYDNATAKQTRQTLDFIKQYMKIYTINMGNARQHLIEYVNTAETYIGPDDPDYWNDQYRQDAMQAKDQAAAALTEGDKALMSATLQARELQNLQ